MNKFIFAIVLLLFNISLNAQKDTTDGDSLKFVIDINVVEDFETEEVLEEAKVKIIGTDGSSRDYFTNKQGAVLGVKLKPNTSYSIIVSKEGYLLVKGKETTLNVLKSVRFVHEYSLKASTCGGRMRLFPLVYYDHNNLTEYTKNDGSGKLEVIDIEAYNALGAILKENPTIVIEIAGYRNVDEKESLSMNRVQQAKNRFVEMGIDAERIVIKDGGIISVKDIGYLTFKILNFDHIPK